ncbi:hypothetical protein C8J57DRAFT_1112471 [Mycena rebaudengoi]|nr:hypothetical protein C8J57DRAFT_1112471 [Mycena rebaudengoi]
MRLGRRAEFDLANGQAAIAQNEEFKNLKADSPCTAGKDACVNNGFAQCVNGKFVIQPCGGGTICAALPVTTAPGTTIACTTQADLDTRIAATGATAGAAAGGAAAPPPVDNAGAGNGAAAGGNVDAQDSTTIDPKVLQTTDDGQNPPVDGQSAALVSKNNFANFCLLGLPNVPITNGLQVTTGSCNPIPIGNIPAQAKMPSGKFQSPKNGDTVAADTAFTVTMAVKNIQLGTFTNAQKTYFANPQTLNNQGVIIGHTHFVIESIPSLDSTAITDPTKFVFFKGINGAANAQGQVSAEVPAPGLPAGTYRLGSIVTASTHQPAIVPVAQHGLLDDVVYFTATAGGAAAAAPAAAAAGAAAA